MRYIKCETRPVLHFAWHSGIDSFLQFRWLSIQKPRLESHLSASSPRCRSADASRKSFPSLPCFHSFVDSCPHSFFSLLSANCCEILHRKRNRQTEREWEGSRAHTDTGFFEEAYLELRRPVGKQSSNQTTSVKALRQEMNKYLLSWCHLESSSLVINSTSSLLEVIFS